MTLVLLNIYMLKIELLLSIITFEPPILLVA